MTQQQLEAHLWGAAIIRCGLVDAGDYKRLIFPLVFSKRLPDVWDEDHATALAEVEGRRGLRDRDGQRPPPHLRRLVRARPRLHPTVLLTNDDAPGNFRSRSPVSHRAAIAGTRSPGGPPMRLASLIATGETLAIEFESDVNDIELVDAEPRGRASRSPIRLEGHTAAAQAEEEMSANAAVMRARILKCATYARASALLSGRSRWPTESRMAERKWEATARGATFESLATTTPRAAHCRSRSTSRCRRPTCRRRRLRRDRGRHCVSAGAPGASRNRPPSEPRPACAVKLRANPRIIRVQDMRRQWSSCWSAGTVTLAGDLADQNPRFQDFVIVHELLHLRVPTHGRLFTALISAHFPGWRELEEQRGLARLNYARGAS